MKVIERYNLLKKEYPKYIVLVKNGIFFTTYHNDAYILNYIFDYQVCNERVGFPISILNNILEEIKDYSINIYIENEQDMKYEFKNNVYEEILKIAKKNYLQELNIKVLLEEIENLLKSNSENLKKIGNFINEL